MRIRRRTPLTVLIQIELFHRNPHQIIIQFSILLVKKIKQQKKKL